MAGASGLGNVFQAIGYGAKPGFDAYSAVDQIIQQSRQRQAQNALAKVFQQLASQQASGQGQPLPQGMGTPMGPIAPAAGGVSPQVAGNAMPAGGAPGGAGPQAVGGPPPANGGAPASVMGMDPRIIRMLAAQGGNPDVQGYAMQNLATVSKPVNTNATRIEVANQAEQGRNQRAALSASTRMQIARQTAAACKAAGVAAPKLKDDLQFRALEDELNGAKTLYNANPSDDNLQAYHTAATNLAGYARGKTPAAAGGTTPAGTSDSAPAAGAGVGFTGQPAIDPATNKAVSDGTIADDPATGAAYTAKGGIWQPLSK